MPKSKITCAVVYAAAAFSLVAQLAPPVHAQIVQTEWTGASGNLWRDPGNWTNGIPFYDPVNSAGRTAILPSGSFELIFGNLGSSESMFFARVDGNYRYTASGRFTTATGINVRPSGRFNMQGLAIGNETLVVNSSVNLQGGGLFSTSSGRVTLNGRVNARRGTFVLGAGDTGNFTFTQFTDGATGDIFGNANFQGALIVESGSVVDFKQGSSVTTSTQPGLMRLNGGRVLLNGSAFNWPGPISASNGSQLQTFVPTSFQDVSLDGSTLDIGSNAGTFSAGFIRSVNSVMTLTPSGSANLDIVAGITVDGGSFTYGDSSQISASSLQVRNGAQVTGSTLNLTTSLSQEAILGDGDVMARISGGINSSIFAEGTLNLGIVTSADGFQTAGELIVDDNSHAHLRDADRAQLGVMTRLSSGGQLSSINGIDLGPGETVLATGTATVGGVFTNGGEVAGPANGVLDFTGPVDGIGNYTGRVRFSNQLNPGAGPATINLQHVEFGPGNQLLLDLNGQAPGSEHDQLNAGGSAQLDGQLVLNSDASFAPTVGDEIRILNVSESISGTFSGLPQASHIGNFDGTDLFIHYAAGDGNDVSLVAPQPGDFDFDGDVDVDDIDALAVAAMAGSTNPLYDLNGDGLAASFAVGDSVDPSDSDILVRSILGTEYGDANLDHQVDILDLALLGEGFQGAGTGWSFGDFDGSTGGSDVLDLDVLGQFFGFDGTASPAVSVPEPGSVSMWGAALCTCLLWNRSRSKTHPR